MLVSRNTCLLYVKICLVCYWVRRISLSSPQSIVTTSIKLTVDVHFQNWIVEDTILSPLCSFDTLFEDHLTIYMWGFFWAFYSVPLLHVSVFMLIPYYFYYYSFVICFELRKCETVSSFFSSCLAIWGPLRFHMNFRIFFSFLQKKMTLRFW